MEINKNIMKNIELLAEGKKTSVNEQIEMAISVYISLHLLPSKERFEIYSQLAAAEFKNFNLDDEYGN